MVGPDGVLPLPWLGGPLSQALRTTRAHALLIHGLPGVGQFELAMVLAQAWLCDTPANSSSTPRPCGTCASCRLVQSRSHPDLLVLLPEALRETLGWSNDVSGDEGAVERGSKAKPSKEIKVEALRGVVAFAQTTSARGRHKVVVVHPAERMNAIAANTLLKTLEEPPGDARFILSCSAPETLLPTIRSRCQALPLVAPPADQALEWLKAKGVEGAGVLLRATGGQPVEALEWAQQGMGAELWLRLPGAVLRGDVATLSDLALPRLVNALQKICHDAMCLAVGGVPRFFPPAALEHSAGISALARWAQSLTKAARTVEHPWHAGLMAEALVQEGQRALMASGATGEPNSGASVHYAS